MSETQASAFDPEAFMHEEHEAPMETAFTPVDEDEYEAFIDLSLIHISEPTRPY